MTLSCRSIQCVANGWSWIGARNASTVGAATTASKAAERTSTSRQVLMACNSTLPISSRKNITPIRWQKNRMTDATTATAIVVAGLTSRQVTQAAANSIARPLPTPQFMKPSRNPLL